MFCILHNYIKLFREQKNFAAAFFCFKVYYAGISQDSTDILGYTSIKWVSQDILAWYPRISHPLFYTQVTKEAFPCYLRTKLMSKATHNIHPNMFEQKNSSYWQLDVTTFSTGKSDRIWARKHSKITKKKRFSENKNKPL